MQTAILQERDYQIRIVEKTINHYKSGIPSVGIVSPTGSGKTIIAMRFLKWVKENEPDLTVNWVAMRRQLLRQAAQINGKMFGLNNIRFVSMFDPNPKPADIIVIDELHHSATKSFNHISNHKLKFLLGMSATPFRTDKLKIPFNKIVRDCGIHRLIQEGWLSKYQHWCMETYTPETAAIAYLANRDRWSKTLVFFHQIVQCEEFQNILAKHNVKCEVVSGSTTNVYREEQLDAFDRGEYDVIANAMILAEGFDCPDLRTIFCRDSAKLPTIQMAGRAFRICEGKMHCNIVQSKMSKWQFTKTAKPERCWIQKGDQWLALGSNAKVNTVVRTMVTKLINAEAAIPQFILKNRKKRRALQRNQ